MIESDKIHEYIFCELRKRFKSLSDAAKHYDCSIAYLSAVQTGRKKPGKKLLDDLGIEKIVIYKPTKGVFMFEEGDVVRNKKTRWVYQIIGTEAHMSHDDLRDYVVYRSITSEKIWIREKEEFEQKFENHDF